MIVHYRMKRKVQRNTRKKAARKRTIINLRMRRKRKRRNPVI
jgi:hypothetical protein